MEITAAQVKELREKTGAGVMDCKTALRETAGDVTTAIEQLRKSGILKAAKKADRATGEGIIVSYVHAGDKLAVLIEINCETDFVARTDQFRAFARDVAMHVAAQNPLVVSRGRDLPGAGAGLRQAGEHRRQDRGWANREVLLGGLPSRAAVRQRHGRYHRGSAQADRRQPRGEHPRRPVREDEARGDRLTVERGRLPVPAAYGRVIGQVSGEALAGEDGRPVSREAARRLAGELKAAADAGVEVGVVVGGGNIVRGVAAEKGGDDRLTADFMGMTATIINGLALGMALRDLGQPAVVMSAIPCGRAALSYDHRAAEEALSNGNVVVLTAGTGNPFFSTDTAAVLRACELGADALIKATKADGVYDSDPAVNPDARRFTELSYMDVIQKKLAVMDMTAVSLAREENLPIVVLALAEPGGIAKAVVGEAIGTSVKGV